MEQVEILRKFIQRVQAMKSPDHNGEDNFARDFMVSPYPSCRLLSPAPEPPAAAAAVPGRAAPPALCVRRRGEGRRGAHPPPGPGGLGGRREVSPPPPLGLLSPPPAFAATSAGALGAEGEATGPSLQSAPPPTTYCFSCRESEASEVSRHLPIRPVPPGRTEAGCLPREESGSRLMEERGCGGWHSLCGGPCPQAWSPKWARQKLCEPGSQLLSQPPGRRGLSVRYLAVCRIPIYLGPVSRLLRSRPETQSGGPSDFRWRG